MVFVSVTRLRVRSFRFLIQFIVRSARTMRQAERADGFLCGKVLREAKNTFWTITLWSDATAMNAYRTTSAHRDAMPKLLKWCDEASVAHWEQDSAECPSWQDAYRRMVTEGRPSKVNYPSQDHIRSRIPALVSTKLQQTLKPKRD